MNLQATTDGRLILTTSEPGEAMLILAGGQSLKIVDDGQKLSAFPTPEAVVGVKNHIKKEKKSMTAKIPRSVISAVMSEIGRRKSPAKSRASARNGKKGGRPKKYSPDEILALLPSDGLTTKEWFGRAKMKCGVSQYTFHKIRRGLEKSGRISKVDGKWRLRLKGDPAMPSPP